MHALKSAVRIARDYWFVILAVLINLAIGGPVAAAWDNDYCVVNGHAVPCCTDCTFFCSCGESPAP